VARLGNVRQFGLRELQAATDGFSAKNIVGKGGFGDVTARPARDLMDDTAAYSLRPSTVKPTERGFMIDLPCR
jgi:hypothetical protein